MGGSLVIGLLCQLRLNLTTPCEWLRELHSVGLLRGSFRPTAAILALRARLRHRDTLVKSAGTYVQRMQKALIEMNLLLPRVVSDITGRTGLLILRAVVAGERNPHVLAQHRDPRCKATRRRSRPRSPATTATSTSSC